ncbi:TorF family putative porin [Candidatus Methylocalor cossyra]|uniref:Outer membrane protein beta-barrel domain-containing protein n=1 Tax=Candidatus Methylocalor cossyra TaxID=3108543 RepID=A0ABP1C9J4_9GAMM
MKFDAARWLMALAALSGPVEADFQASVRFMSDAVYRGYSKTRGQPSGAVDLEYGHRSGWYAGLALTRVSFDDRRYRDRAELEIAPYLGWSGGLVSDWRVDVGLRRYFYDGKLFGRSSDFNEFQGALQFRDRLTLSIAFADHAYARNATTLAYELTGRQFLSDTWQVSLGLGYYQASALLGGNALYWNAGVTWYPYRFVAVDLRYVDSSVDRYRPGRGVYPFYLRPLESQLLFTLSLGLEGLFQ